ncbi:2-polyprenyl-6-methoxyphenol hydroxylase [Micromonospora coriariae]|uniref:2-polyprenyl-6-methoxyphenol hydroxylase n=1 Tax=Micromonospora coriariae TaxID=285665 RepID=A0A1C4WVV8_9ACTN|nr:FAD-dependent monooxygenase [Micromonospora coriariae]SCF00365.1 2-polyprenyl-6-methoxyphenol hydroxylase [Micromonospora coriariae]
MSHPLPLRGLRVLVSGAGVAGPSLAWWLTRYGADVTVVELAPALRASGFAVDFRGPTHLRVLAAMGVLDELRAVQTHGGAMSCVDERDREIFRLPAEFAGGELEVYRRDLSRILHRRSADRAEYLFGDQVTALTEAADGVHVTLDRAGARTVDLVVGADGLHSGVRRLAFGPEREYVRHLGYQLAGWDLPNELGVGVVAQQYNVPGRMASVAADQRDPARAGAFVVFTAPDPEGDWYDIDQQKKIITTAFGGLGWHVPQLLAGLRDAPELYFDSISKVRVPRWHAGRTALLGDAAWGVTLGGMGVGTGVVGGYVLAGELAAAGGDHRVAFPAYERRLRDYAMRWQRGANPGTFLAPATAGGLWLRNRLLRNRPVQALLVRGTRSLATDLDLPDYPAPS